MSTPYVGEGVYFALIATDPLLDTPITSDVTVEISFFAPPKNPAAPTTNTDRVADFGPFAMSYDADVINKNGTVGAWVVTQDTTGFTPGKWWYQAEVSGAYNTWIYGSFKLKV